MAEVSLANDIEKSETTAKKRQIYDVNTEDSSDSLNAGAIHEKDLIKRGGFIGKFHAVALKYRMEARGIERVPEDERFDKSVYSPAYFWWAVNMVLSPVSIGALGVSAYGLSFWDSALTIFFFTILGTIPAAFYSTFGPEFGLRQMHLSRFWFGHNFTKVFGFFQTIACVGWSALNTIFAAEMLHSVNGGALPAWTAMLIIALATTILTLFGYRTVHMYEKYAWIPAFVIFFIIIARLKLSGAFTAGVLSTGKAEVGGVLSFGATLFGSATGWGAYGADFCVYQKKDANKTKLFWSVLFAIAFPLIFTGILGAACMTATLANPAFEQQYNDNGIGGLIYGILVTDSLHGFGQFCVVLLALSTIACNCANIYSIAFSIQIVSHHFTKIPRIILTFIGICAFFGISMGAYYDFETYMENFMNLIGYWLAIYEAISLPEHFFFRRGLKGYVVDDVNRKERLPPGWASMIAFCCGVAGIVVGMNQIWWVGPLAKLTLADLGFELAFGFTLVAYAVARPIEYHYYKR
ncbi:permease for cytosine/purines, uracil, thiamine, allantoin-domain-containing protein [Lipomyces japonicus]|uniref:permease for cytosine/purines, uracil, thiamine, allantoin-domain-containing protein n=1 Tax=Lipomyces japonicus TaxID=56871 RepID=UPI0034CD403C